MSPKYRFTHSDYDLEKASLSETLIARGHSEEGRRPFFSLPLENGVAFFGSTASSVADCLSSFSACQPSASHDAPIAYEAVMTTVSRAPVAVPETSQHVSGRAYPAGGRASNPTQTGESFNVDFPTQPENWLSSEAADATHYHLQTFPALQPTLTTSAGPITEADPQLTRVQPNMHLESMYYPDGGMPSNNFHKTEAEDIVSIRSIPPTTIPVSMVQAPAPQVQHCIQNVPTNPGFSQPPIPATANAQYTIPSPILLPDCAPVAYAASNVTPTQASHVSAMPARSTEVAMPHTMVVAPYPTTMPPHYTTPMPVATIEHHRHHNRTEVAITPYVSDPSFDMTARQHPRPPAARRGPFKDQADRQKTAQTRIDGCCIRCRMQRIRCNAYPEDPRGVCEGCKKSQARTWRLPCLRLKISDVILSKTTQVKGHEWTLRWKENTVLDDVGHWASSEVRIVRISEGYTDEFVQLRVRKFIPQDGDSLSRSWVTPNGQTRSVTIPPYAVIEPEAIAPQYNAYIKRGLVACCNNVLESQKGTVLWPTYWVAVKRTRVAGSLPPDEHTLLTKTLDLWMTVRLTTRSFELVGEETLDMPTNILDETSPSYGKIPIPPVMGAQLDSVLIHEIQHNLRRDVLDRLQKMVHANKTSTWFTTYLAIFILLHNAALVIKHDASYARKHGLKRRFAREDKVQQYYTGAITLLAYFHYCNKGVFPFTESARDQDIRNLANLDDDAMGVFLHTRQYAIDNKEKWQASREANDYEDEFYFIGQLYEVNWQPRTMVL